MDNNDKLSHMQRSIDDNIHETKGYWTPEEDEEVRRLVEMHGDRWDLIANAMKNTRKHKQIRDRWINHLSPNINKTPLTDFEKQKIVALHDAIGKKWSRIASSLPIRGRTALMVKNYWYNRRRTQTLRIRDKMSVKRLLNNKEK
jgi:myb proto-oncogene protein